MHLDLGGNNLTGDVPRKLRSLNKLAHLSLDGSVSSRNLLPHQQRLAVSSATVGDDGGIKTLIAGGESKTVEFKQTLRGLWGDGKPEHAALKSIAGLLNTDGGHLFIGIRNNKEACGIEAELETFEGEDQAEREDDMLQHLANIVEDRMTDGAWNRIHPKFHVYGGRRILVIRCDQWWPGLVSVKEGKGQRARYPVYARTGPKTKELQPHEVLPHDSSRTLQSAAPGPEE